MAKEEKKEARAPAPGAFQEYGVSGLDFTAGMINADPKLDMHGRKGAEQYDLMRHEDPTVAAVLLALTLPVREATWRVNPASDASVDKEAAEFVEQCMHDMSGSWDDVLTEACTMYPFGWAWMEWVLKRRVGRRPGGGKPASKYDDGRVGWRKMALRSQTSLFEWEMDPNGGAVAMIQEDVHGGPLRRIPLQKSLLFRTTKERNNPEGFSVLRPSHRPWKFKYQVERIEAIGLQRALQGVPVVGFDAGYTSYTEQGADSDEFKAQSIIKGLYANTSLGVIETDRMTFRFETPDMQGITGDSSRVITRLDEAMARSALAMYILLGSRERGSYALARELSDLFFLAIEGYIGMISQVFSMWAVPTLFEYNVFPGITEYPEITTSLNRRIDLEVLGNFINKAVSMQVITPDDDLERHIRELADFPPLAEAIGLRRPAAAVVTSDETPGKEGDVPPAQSGEQASARPPKAPLIGDIEEFIGLAQGNRLNAYHAATDAYRDELRGEYAGWIEDLASEFATVPEGDLAAANTIWDEAIVALLLLFRRRAWHRFPEALAFGYGIEGMPPTLWHILEEELAANDSWMQTKLVPAIKSQMSSQDISDVMMMYWGGKENEAAGVVQDMLVGRAGHVGQYAGHFWRMLFLGALERLDEEDYSGPVQWVRDLMAQSCNDCMLFGEREYNNMADLLSATGGILPGQGTQCNGHCRCYIRSKSGSGTWIVI